jgi:hypothetical protein
MSLMDWLLLAASITWITSALTAWRWPAMQRPALLLGLGGLGLAAWLTAHALWVHAGPVSPLAWARMACARLPAATCEWDLITVPRLVGLLAGWRPLDVSTFVWINRLLGALALPVLYVLWRRLGLRDAVAAPAAALFVLSPHWLRLTATPAFEPAALALTAGCLAAYARWWTDRGRAPDLGPAALLLLALFTRSEARMLWILLPALAWTLGRRGERDAAPAAWPRVPWVGLAVLGAHGTWFVVSWAAGQDDVSDLALANAVDPARAYEQLLSFWRSVTPGEPVTPLLLTALAVGGLRALPSAARHVAGAWLGLGALGSALACGTVYYQGLRPLPFLLAPFALGVVSGGHALSAWAGRTHPRAAPMARTLAWVAVAALTLAAGARSTDLLRGPLGQGYIARDTERQVDGLPPDTIHLLGHAAGRHGASVPLLTLARLVRPAREGPLPTWSAAYLHELDPDAPVVHHFALEDCDASRPPEERGVQDAPGLAWEDLDDGRVWRRLTDWCAARPRLGGPVAAREWHAFRVHRGRGAATPERQEVRP